MSVQSVSASDSASATWWTEMLKKKEAQETQDSGSVTMNMPAASAELSPMAQMLSKLDALAKSDPDKFKEVTADLAAQLSEAAKNATGKDAEFLNRMAEQFSTASESGDVSALRPPRPPQASYDGSDTTKSGTMPTPPTGGGPKGGPSSEVRSILDGIFESISAL